MPTLAEIESIRDDCFADDVEIDFDVMRDWTKERCTLFFENGGEDRPPPPPPVSYTHLTLPTICSV